MNGVDSMKLGVRCTLKGFEYEITEVTESICRLNAITSKLEVFLRHEKVPELISCGDLTLAPDTLSDWNIALLQDPNQRRRHHRKLFYCSEAYRQYGARLPRSSLEEFIQQAAKRFGEEEKKPPSVRTLRRWFKRYTEGAMAPSSLIASKNQPNKRILRLPDESRDLIHDYLHNHYLGEERMSLKYAYELMLNHIFHENDCRAGTSRPPIKIPSYETFRTEMKKISPIRVMEKRYGKYAAQRAFKYSKRIRGTTRIGERVESDSNYMDIILVNRLNEVIGRPYLCALMDIHTRCIIGWEISFCPPSAAKTLRALRYAITTESASPFTCVMDELILDNGPEFANASLEAVTLTFNISLRYVAPRQPDEKAHIERFFRTMNEQLIHLLPGTTFSSTRDREDYDSEKQASLTIDQLREYFRDWLENVYHKAEHRMIQSSPKNQWEKSAINWKPPTCAKDEVDKLCRRVVKRGLKGGRVRYDNLFWYGPSLAIFQHQLKVNETVNVFIDETDLGTVWVQSPTDPHTVVQADAVDPELQNGLSMYEYELIKKELSANKQDLTSTKEKLAAQAALRNKIKSQGKKGRKKQARLEGVKNDKNKSVHTPSTNDSSNTSTHLSSHKNFERSVTPIRNKPRPTDCNTHDIDFEVVKVKK